MRTFVDLPGGNGKIKRLNNRISGDDRDDRNDRGASRPTQDDPHKARRQSRQLLRRVVTGDDLSDLQLDD